MDVRFWLGMLRRHGGIVIAAMAVCIAAALFQASREPRIYEAQTQMFVASTGDASGNSGVYQGGLFVQAQIKSYAQIANSSEVAAGVVNRLHLQRSPTEVASQLSAEVPGETVLVNLSARDSSPKLSQAMAEAASEEFATLVQTIEPTAAGGRPSVRIVTVKHALLPTAPVSPRRTVFVGLGALVGLGIGVAAASVRQSEPRSRRRRSVVEPAPAGMGDAVAAASIPRPSPLLDPPPGAPLGGDGERGQRKRLTAPRPFNLDAVRRRRQPW